MRILTCYNNIMHPGIAKLVSRLVWDQEVAGSNPVTPTTCGCSSMVEHQPSKLDTWVRFPSPAFVMRKKKRECKENFV